MCVENGFEILIDAFIKLKDTSRFKNARLKVTGGSTGDDKKFIQKQVKKLKQKGYLDDVEIVSEFTTDKLGDFFRDITVMSVPVLNGEAFGLYQLEALASGIPVVQPALGAFPEIAEQTGGGVIYHPNSADALSKVLEEILSDSGRLLRLSKAGRQSVEEHFNTAILTKKMVEIYEKVVST
jgi:glycosyltransferase involved in cell wall biosynthesis